MLRDVEASCPGCQAKVRFDVEVPDPHISVKLIEDTSRVDALAKERDALTQDRDKLSNERDTFKGQSEATRDQLRKWETGENHLQAPDMLNLLLSCPNCRPTLEAFAQKQRQEAVAALTPDQVKELARKFKFWPPPTIDLGPMPGRAR